MLPRKFKPKKYDAWDREPWPDYVARLGLPDHEPTLQFFRQVAYDHLDHFNNHYPDFELEEYSIDIESFTAQQANDLVRTLGNKVMDWWAEQYEEFRRRDYPYVIYQEMSQNLTPPFPPVVFEVSKLVDSRGWVYGRPYHLIEGTHRVSYLRHMLAEGIITPESEHRFVVLRPRCASAT